jgi:hypothetical protein
MRHLTTLVTAHTCNGRKKEAGWLNSGNYHEAQRKARLTESLLSTRQRGVEGLSALY